MKRKKSPKQKLKILYGCRDMLTGLKNKTLDYHHIIKKEDDGPKTIENGALLERKCHEWLHYFEIIDPEMYHLINECLALYKKCIDLGHIKLIQQYENEIFPEVVSLVDQHTIGLQKTKFKL
ncbi:MAG: HNH endonuclease [Bacilli bacterium]|nr:HNH endonuclease [Bacilli bacterium]MDD4795702.1 HNH endonuclease [Bacilli bacterium]